MTEPDDPPPIGRAVVYTPAPGDVVVLEVGERIIITPEQADRLKDRAEATFGRDVQIVVLAGAHFAGVVRDDTRKVS